MISRKIKENKGITIIHALVSVLIFGVFSSIILNAASSNVKSIDNQLAYQQAYLTVSSASDLFVEGFKNDYIEHIVMKDADGNVTSNQWYYRENENGLNNPLYTVGSSENDTFLNMFTSLKEDDDEYEYVMVVSGTVNNTQETLPEVAIKMYLNEEEMNVDFSLNTSQTTHNYYMTVCIPFIVEEITNKDRTTNIKTITTKMIFNTDNIVIGKGVYEKVTEE